MQLDFSTLSNRDLKEAIKLGWTNYESVTVEFQPELMIRLNALKAESAKRGLTKHGASCCEGVAFHSSNCPVLRG